IFNYFYSNPKFCVCLFIPVDHNYAHLLKPWRLVDINPPGTDEPDSESDSNGPLEQISMSEKQCTPAGESVQSEEFGEEKLVASDYVNASLIPGRAPGVAYCLVGGNLLPRTYIAAQAPVQHTMALFWQMVWDHRVQLVVALTRLTESGKDKCVQYWPGPSGETPSDTSTRASNTLRLGHLRIKLLRIESNPTYVKRKFILRNALSKDDQSQTVTQLHMLKWPDFSAPTERDFRSLLQAYWTERLCCTSFDAPVLVHCSAGIGRTGTFICLDQLCRQIRYYLQPSFPPPNPPTSGSKTEEPVYVNLNEYTTEAKSVVTVGNRAVDNDIPGEDAVTSGRQALLRNSDSRSAPRRRRFGLGRRKMHCIDVYKTVLWLRSNRAFMVQSEEQYLFIYRFLSFFIQETYDSGHSFQFTPALESKLTKWEYMIRSRRTLADGEGADGRK
ncbi:uncharacterized protein DEA37_0002354, partial [Paragonimus westermani]